MSLVYLDEDLPEIEIRELISGDDYVSDVDIDQDKKVGINIYSSEDIYNQTLLLLQTLSSELAIPLKRKAKAFQKLHQKVVQDTPFVISANIIPEVSIQRKDNGDEDVFFEAYDEAHKINKHDTRVQELHKAFLGYETTNEDAPQFQTTISTHVFVKDSVDEQIIVLPKDALRGKVTRLFTKIGVSPFHKDFSYLSLADKQLETQEKGSILPIDDGLSFQENIEKALYSSIDHVVKGIKEIGSLYDLWKEFLRYGIDIDTLHPRDFKKLIEQLEEIKKKDTEVFKLLKMVQSYRPVPLQISDEYSVYGFYSVQKGIFEKMRPVLQLFKEQLLELYQGFIDSIPISSSTLTNLPSTAFDIAAMIMENKVTIEEVIHVMKVRLLHEQKSEIEKWYRLIQKWDLETIEEAVEKEFNQASKTLISIRDEPYEDWQSIHEEIKHIKKGEVLSKEYEEDMGPSMDQMFIKEIDMMLEKDDPDEITIPVYDDSLPVDIQHLDEGKREIYDIVLRMFVALQRASGLPLDYIRLTQSIPGDLRKTKMVQIHEAFPEFSHEIHTLINSLDLDTLDSMLETFVDPSMYQTTRAKFQKIYKGFLKDIQQQWVYLLGWWICDIQSHVLQRTLQFQIWNGSLQCIQVWSPYGMPMEGLKHRKEGVVPYLLCVIYELVLTRGTLWNRYAKQVTNDEVSSQLDTLFEQDLADTVKELQTKFRTFEKDLPAKNLLHKGEQVKKQITDTVDQRLKNRYLADYMYFLKNLPSVLIQSSIAKKLHIGCCLQMLSDKYRADYDWAGYVKNAYKIKKLFATQRSGFEKRPVLIRSGKERDEAQITVMEAVRAEIPTYRDWIIQDWMEQLEIYMPLGDYRLLESNVQKIQPVTEKYMDILMKSLPTDSTVKEFVYQASTQDLLKFMRKILQIQYLYIQTSYEEKPDEFAYLQKEFGTLHMLHEMLLDNNHITSELQDLYKRRVLQYFIVRQLCFPAKPEFARNNTLVLLEDRLDASLLTNYLRDIFDVAKQWVYQYQFNKSVNYMDYIAKVREQENIGKLKVIDLMNSEERRLYVDAKKLGIKELDEYIRQFKDRQEEENQYREAADEYEEDGEDEKYPVVGENDDEADPDMFNDDEY